MKKKLTAALASAGLLMTLGFAAIAPAQAAGPPPVANLVAAAPTAASLASAPSSINIGAFAAVKKATPYGKAAKVLADGYAVRVWNNFSDYSVVVKPGKTYLSAYKFQVPSGKKAKVTNYLGKTATLGPGKHLTIKGASHSIKIYDA